MKQQIVRVVMAMPARWLCSTSSGSMHFKGVSNE